MTPPDTAQSCSTKVAPLALELRDKYRLFADGAQCGKYRIRRLIAKGGMSEVYEALQVELGKRVALKVLSPELRDNPEACARFATEAVNTACLWHTNVVDVIDFGSWHGLPYLVMNLLVGSDLATLFARRGRIEVGELVDLLLPIACAVAAGHELGIMHRDLKPENIYLHCEGRRVIPKLLDFGVSRRLGAQRITITANVFGTPHYMAPEQARGELTTDPRADQYALGVILYEGVTGRLPRDSEHPQVLLHSVAFGDFPAPSAHGPIPAELEALILRAMSSAPDARFPSMHAFASALLPFASDAMRPYFRALLGLPPLVQERGLPPTASEQREVLDVRTLLRTFGLRPLAWVCLLLLLVAASAWTVERRHDHTLAAERVTE